MVNEILHVAAYGIPNSCMQYFKRVNIGLELARVYWIIILLLEPAIEICIQHKLLQPPVPPSHIMFGFPRYNVADTNGLTV